jgi:hypothetical protein
MAAPILGLANLAVSVALIALGGPGYGAPAFGRTQWREQCRFLPVGVGGTRLIPDLPDEFRDCPVLTLTGNSLFETCVDGDGR